MDRHLPHLLRIGREDDPTGIYVRTGRWSAACILPNIDREQANEIIDAIFAHFPEIVLAEEPPSLFDKLPEFQHEIIRLGLSGHGEGPQST